MKEQHFREKDKSVSMQTNAEYRAYIEARTGADMKNKKPREKIDTLARVATAYMLMKASSTKRFSENLINRKAEKIKQTLDLTDLHEAEIDEMLSSPEKLRKGVNHQLTTLYAHKADMSDYIKKMKTLADNMPMDDSRSAEYNTMAKCIKDIAGMDPATAEKNKDEIIAKNYKLMQSIEKNIGGKERVRRTTMGVEHFNTALDALSIMNDHNPALNDKTAAIVDKINYTRGAESIKEFGAARSITAKKNRAQMSKDKKLERTLDKDKLKKKQMEHPAMGR